MSAPESGAPGAAGAAGRAVGGTSAPAGTSLPAGIGAQQGGAPPALSGVSSGARAGRTDKPTLAVWKFASCDGCQLTLLDCEEALLPLAGAVQIAYFLEATRATVEGPYDLSIIEGSITTPHDVERIAQIRARSRFMVSIGACATAGGIQALRNFANVDEFMAIVYATPAYISTLRESTPPSAHVRIDYELQGCPPNPDQLLDVIAAFLQQRRPAIAADSVCMECKRRGNVCVMVAHGTPCLGPNTHAGCGALCPTYHRGCYGCFGPMETPNTASLAGWLHGHGQGNHELVRLYRSIYAGSPRFRAESEARAQESGRARGGERSR